MKRLLSILLCLILFAALSACGDTGISFERISADEIVRVTATDSVYSSYMYVIEDKEAISQLCDLYNSLSCRELGEGEEAPDDLMSGKLYSLIFYNADDEVVTDCWISPKGYVRFRNTEDTTYVLTGKFDENKLAELLEQFNTFK